MRADGLEKIICVGSTLESSVRSAELAAEFKDVYATVGIHPHYTDKVTDACIEKIAALADNKKVVAIGEIGLDYFHNFSAKDAQKKWLEAQIDVACQTRLPIVFHLRDAYGDMQEIVLRHIKGLSAPAVMHCFSGSAETAKFYTDLGFYISFSGAVTFKKTKAAEVIKAIPRDRVLIETDCPYLAPEPFRGKDNQPKYVRFAAMKIAEVWGESVEEAARQTTENAYRLFEKMNKDKQ